MTKSSGLPLFRCKLTGIGPCLGAACSQLAVGGAELPCLALFCYKMLDAFRLRKYSYGALVQHSVPTRHFRVDVLRHPTALVLGVSGLAVDLHTF